MDDLRINQTIEQLVDEEDALWGLEAAGYATEVDRKRLRELRVSLDQVWDLLRQRRVLEKVGLDRDAVRVRPPGVVERYSQ